MATYGTPQYDYTRRTNALAQNKAMSDAANQYGRFLSQQRFRRNREDAGIQMKRTFPKVGQSFQNRGLWNSGIRREGQRQYLGDYNRDIQRSLQDEQSANQGFDMQQTMQDSTYQQALLDLYEQLQAARANVNPFAGLYLPGGQ